MSSETEDEYNPDELHPIVTEGDWGMWTDEDHFADKAYPPQSRSQQQDGLRNRLYSALLDLHLVFEHMPIEERRRVYDRLSSRDPDESVHMRDWSLRQGEYEVGLRALSGVMALLYEASFENGVPFELVLEQGVRRATEQNVVDAPPGSMITVSVGQINVNITQPDSRAGIESALKDLQQGASIEDLTTAEQAALLRWYSKSDQFDPERAFAEFENDWIAMIEDVRNRPDDTDEE